MLNIEEDILKRINEIYLNAGKSDLFSIEDYLKTSRSKGNLARFVVELRPYLHSIERDTQITPNIVLSNTNANVYYYIVTKDSIEILVKLISEEFREWVESVRNISFYKHWKQIDSIRFYE